MADLNAVLGAQRRSGWRHTLRRLLGHAVRVWWVLSLLRRWAFRYQALLWPVWILAGLGLWRWWALETAPATVAAVTLLGCAVVAFYLRHRLDRRPEWVYALSCLAAVELGALAVSVAGSGVRALNVACAAAWSCAAVVWWSHHPISRGAPPPQIVERWDKFVGMNYEEDEADDIVTRWRNHIG